MVLQGKLFVQKKQVDAIIPVCQVLNTKTFWQERLININTQYNMHQSIIVLHRQLYTPSPKLQTNAVQCLIHLNYNLEIKTCRAVAGTLFWIISRPSPGVSPLLPLYGQTENCLLCGYDYVTFVGEATLFHLLY